MKRILLLSYVLFNSLQVLAQGEIPVDMHTGQPSIGIPIWQIQDYNILTSVSLGYSTTTIRAGQLSGDFGVGWSLAAGGSITRQVRGLPDEWKGSDSRKGWLIGGSIQASNFGSHIEFLDYDCLYANSVK